MKGCGEEANDRLVSAFFFSTRFPASHRQEDDESGHLYNARLRYYYNKCVEGRGTARGRRKPGF